ncbi:hypothetical protein CLV59_105374 [Chitinophaga dinghuensis]|uniref:Uncharacterized protein n=1 Tax=Chitinophaga dinghuensis TaxID=1539050 RepID=A0A327VZ85_9BACT|nr:hypothetical protein CLV59_105374 [Chitinophaga dinghuensis]
MILRNQVYLLIDLVAWATNVWLGLYDSHVAFKSF